MNLAWATTTIPISMLQPQSTNGNKVMLENGVWKTVSPNLSLMYTEPMFTILVIVSHCMATYEKIYLPILI